MGSDRDRRLKRLPHDAAGQAYPTGVNPTTGDGRRAGARESVASRTTEEEARDLLALRRSKRGDTGAFAELLQDNDDDVRALLAALVGPGELDAVCTQVYLRAFRGLPIAPSTSPRIWLLGIADGAARDAARRIHQNPGASVRSSVPIPLDRPAEERLVVAAVDAVGLTHRETARLTRCGLDGIPDLLATGRSQPGVSLPFDPPLDHGPRFWDDLGRRLLVEQSAPAASGRLEDASTQRGATADNEVSPTARTLDVARGMALRVGQQHPRTVPWRRIGVAGALVVTVAVCIGVALTLAGHASRRDAGLGDTAAKTLDRLDAALARNTVVRGTVTITAADGRSITSGKFRFVRSNTGSWRLTSSDGAIDEGYDVPTATASTLQRGSGGEVTAALRRGLAPGPPEATGVAEASAGDVLANAIRAVRAGTGGTVTTRTIPQSTTNRTDDASTAESRSVWVVTSRLDGAVGATGLSGSGPFGAIAADEVELVADQSLALPTHLTMRRGAKSVLEVRFSGLSISQQALASSYAPVVPVGTRAEVTDGGFVPTPAGELASVRAGSTRTPSYLPGGYVLASAVANRATKTTVVCYRNGSRQLVLTVRPAPTATADRTDPLTDSDPAADEPRRVTIDSGALAGNEAFSSLTPVHHVWVNAPGTQVVVVGDPPLAQLTKVLASLR